MICAKRRSSRYQRGSVTILVAIAMVSLIGILALVVDYGNVLVAQTALQNYVDAKALAHLKEEFGLPVPRVSIEDNVPFQLGTPDAVPQRGAWRFNASKFDEFISVLQPGVPAIQVPVYQISQPLLLSGFFGVHHQTLSASAVSFVKKRHIVIIQDVSGSMNGTPIQQARSALTTFVDFMADRPMPGDTLGLVAYQTSVVRNTPLTPLDHFGAGELRNQISGLTANGGTATDLGIDAGRQQFQASPDALADQIAILVSDGAPNDPGAAQSARDTLCNANPEIQLNTTLIATTGSNQPAPCNGGLSYTTPTAQQVQNILITILSRQKVRLVE
jgi:hypothetical protein